MNIQDYAVFLIVALAATYLFRSWFVASKSGGGGCGKCSSCPSNSPAGKPEAPLVQIDLGGSWKKV